MQKDVSLRIDESRAHMPCATGDVVAQWLERQNSNPKTLGSIPWWGRVVDGAVFLSLRVNSCDFFFAWPPFVFTARTQNVKDPISICRKGVGLTAGGVWSHTNSAYTKVVIQYGGVVRLSVAGVPWKISHGKTFLLEQESLKQKMFGCLASNVQNL